MFVKVKVAHRGAIKMGLPTQDDCSVVEATLSVVELAGRLTLAAGQVIAPKAVDSYLAGIRRGRLAMECVMQRHDQADLALAVGVESARRRMWAPENVDGIIRWLEYVLVVHFFDRAPADSDEEALGWAQAITIEGLVDECEANFRAAFGLWVQAEAARPRTNIHTCAEFQHCDEWATSPCSACERGFSQDPAEISTDTHRVIQDVRSTDHRT